MRSCTLVCDGRDFTRERHRVQGLQGNSQQQLDAPAQPDGAVAEMPLKLWGRGVRDDRVWSAPVGGDRLSRPCRARFFCSAIA